MLWHSSVQMDSMIAMALELVVLYYNVISSANLVSVAAVVAAVALAASVERIEDTAVAMCCYKIP